MKILWRISQSINNGYDTYSDAVVCAATEEDAIKIDPSEFRVWHDGSWYFQYMDGSKYKEDDHSAWVNDIKDVKAERIGIAEEHIEIGQVICASFHAG
jgi:hypothetical protein